MLVVKAYRKGRMSLNRITRYGSSSPRSWVVRAGIFHLLASSSRYHSSIDVPPISISIAGATSITSSGSNDFHPFAPSSPNRGHSESQNSSNRPSSASRSLSDEGGGISGRKMLSSI